MQYTNDQEELLHPIATVLKAVDGVKKKMDAISEEIEGIEKASMHAHTHTRTHTHYCVYYTLLLVSRGSYRQSWWGRHVRAYTRDVWRHLSNSCKTRSLWMPLYATMSTHNTYCVSVLLLCSQHIPAADTLVRGKRKAAIARIQASFTLVSIYL